MTKEQYFEKIMKIEKVKDLIIAKAEKECQFTKVKLMRKFADSKSKVMMGDVISDGDIKIVVETKMLAIDSRETPYYVFRGVRVSKKGLLFKSREKASVRECLIRKEAE